MRGDIGSAPVGGVAEGAWMDLPLHAWEALPLPIRVQHRLAEILMLVDELRGEFREETAGALSWVDVEAEGIAETVESLLDRFAC
ncbi:MAG TPA: hypothetical protein VF215_00780 [Thermoanaerobaculia bacterium]